MVATDGGQTSVAAAAAAGSNCDQRSQRTAGAWHGSGVERIAQRKYIGLRRVITIHHPSRPQAGTVVGR